MAGLGRKVFTAGDVLTASDVQSYLMDQTVMNFAGTAARASAIATPTEGMVTYLADTNAIQVYDGAAYVAVGGGAGIGQVLQTVKSDTFTMSSNTFADITGFSVSITPTLATSKILVMVDGKFSASDAAVVTVQTRLMRDSTAIYIGDTASNRIRTTFAGAVFSGGSNMGYGGGIFLDSPATTSATTYKLQIASSNNGQSVFVNRGVIDTDNVTYARTTSSITVMEVRV